MVIIYYCFGTVQYVAQMNIDVAQACFAVEMINISCKVMIIYLNLLSNHCHKFRVSYYRAENEKFITKRAAT